MSSKDLTGQGWPGSDPDIDQNSETVGNDSIVQAADDDQGNYIDPDTAPEIEPVPEEKLAASNASRFSRHSDGPDIPWRRS